MSDAGERLPWILGHEPSAVTLCADERYDQTLYSRLNDKARCWSWLCADSAGFGSRLPDARRRIPFTRSFNGDGIVGLDRADAAFRRG
jgi:hypothetical protein